MKLLDPDCERADTAITRAVPAAMRTARTSQVFCELEILVELFLLWLKFEDYREHCWLSVSLASPNAIFSIAVFAKSPSAMPVA
jgi:hypothetical protein